MDDISLGSLEIHIPPEKKYLSLIRNFVGQASSQLVEMPADRLEALKLCVSEAAANSISAHNLLECGEPVIIRLRMFADHVDAEVDDRGTGFDLETMSSSEAALKQGFQEQGRGLALMHDQADVCDISSGKEGTKVRLSVYLTPKTPNL